MTGPEKIVEITNQVIEIKNNIQKKYDRVIGKINGLIEKQAKIVANAAAQSIYWVEKQKNKIQAKIDKLTQDIKDWLNKQLEKVQTWMNNVKKEITDFIKDLLMSPILAAVW